MTGKVIVIDLAHSDSLMTDRLHLQANCWETGFSCDPALVSAVKLHTN